MKKLNRGEDYLESGVCFVKTPQRLRPKCDDLQIYGVSTGKVSRPASKCCGKTAVWSATVTVFWTLQKKGETLAKKFKTDF